MAIDKNKPESIMQLIDAAEVIKVARDLIRIPSPNPPGNEAKVAEYIVSFMNSKGIKTHIQKVLPDRYNVVARLTGQGYSAPLLFSSHMDVVPVSSYEAKRWWCDPFGGEVLNGFLYGRGAADAKGGLAAVMVAMGTLADHRVQPPGDIILAATVDEENLMRGAKALVNSSLISGVSRVICCEPTNLEVQVSCKGRMWAEITVFGQTAHASVRGAGINAIHRALKLMSKIENYELSHHRHPDLGESFWQTTMIQGGVERGIIPDHCTLNVDVRLVPGQTPDDIWKEMEGIFAAIRQEIPDFNAGISELERREPWEICRDDQIVRALANSCQMLKIPLVFSGYIGTAECTIYRRAGVEGTIFGPGILDNNAYKENEKVSLEQLVQASKVYAATMLKWEFD